MNAVRVLLSLDAEFWQVLGGLAAIVLVFPGSLVMLIALDDRKSKKVVAAAESRAYRVTGEVARFAPAATDEYSVDYSFKLVGDNNVYYLTSGMMPAGEHGELTAPGDVVEFRVFPGLKYVRDFKSVATA